MIKKGTGMVTSVSMTLFILIGAAFFISFEDDVNALDQPFSESKWDLVKTINETSFRTTLQANNQNIMVYDEDDIYFGYIRKNENGTFESMLVNSSDGGKNWSEPIVVFKSNNTQQVRIELLIHEDRIFYANMIIFQDGNYYENRRLDCTIIPTSSWDNRSTWNTSRMDTDMPGYIGNTAMVGVGDEVILFWQRSHFANTIYRIHSNGTWGNSRYFLEGKSMMWPVPVVSNISGREKLYVFFSYYPEDSLTMTTSSDGGRNWSEPSVLYYDHIGSFNRLSVKELNGKLHLVVNNRWGNNVYYSNTEDGYNWTNLKKVGMFEYSGDDAIKNSLTLGINMEHSSLFITYDNMTDDSSTVEVLLSMDNGTSFDKVARFGNNTSVRSPMFDERCKFIIYHRSEEELIIREIDFITNEGLEDGDESNDGEDTPNDDNENGTEDNNTKPKENNNETNEEDGNETDPSEGNNETWENGTPVHQGNNPPISSEIIRENGEIIDGEWFTLRAVATDPDMGYGDELTYKWTIVGIGEVGTGEEIQIKLSPGVYTIELLVRDSTGNEIKTSTEIEVGGTNSSDNNSQNRGEELFWLLLVILSILIILITFLSVYFIKKKMADSRKNSVETIKENHDSGKIPIVNSGKLNRSNDEMMYHSNPHRNFSNEIKQIEDESIEMGEDFDEEKRDLRMVAKRKFEDGNISPDAYSELKRILD